MNDRRAILSTRPARGEDLGQVLALLERASLPTAGVADHFMTFLVAESDGTLIGAMGLETYGADGLLRSAVVSDRFRNTGVGSLLYTRLLERARELGIRRLVLLTNTAEEYFRKKGFRRVEMNSVTGPITGSVEFSGACPAHSACMELQL